MPNNSQARKWLLTINNPLECGLDQSAIVEKLHLFFPDYFCMCEEIGGSGTHHTHVYLSSSSPIRFSTIKNRFPTAHIEKSYGSAIDNRDYVSKSGKWANSDKAETSVEGSFFEFGTIPSEKEEKSPKMYQLFKNVSEGMSTIDIISDTPSMAFRIKEIDLLRQTVFAEKYACENRKIEASYIYGASGTGKTSGIYEKHSARDIYRVTNYRMGQGVSFDGYFSQDVLVFEEFNSQIPIEEMLNYLDIYPLRLPARYNDKIACFSKVYITANIPLSAQYSSVQFSRPETWKAFLRRIHSTIEYLPDGTTVEKNIGGTTA
ncbi:MAG: viral replication protein [Defluviitaleaceae bacterium]|nr:viral replication protein [Defluviitaleaceae bacterium]